MFPVRDGRGEEDLWHVHNGGCSVRHVPSEGWWKRGGSLACTHWGTLTDISPQWGMREKRKISVMYAAEDTQ